MMENTISVADYLLAKAAEFRAGKLNAMLRGQTKDANYCDAAAIIMESLAARARLEGWVTTKQDTQGNWHEQLKQENKKMRDLLHRLHQWDVLDNSEDGVYWSGEIGDALASAATTERNET